MKYVKANESTKADVGNRPIKHIQKVFYFKSTFTYLYGAMVQEIYL